VVYPPTGSMALTGRWAPRLRSGGAWPTLPFFTQRQQLLTDFTNHLFSILQILVAD